MTAAARGPGAPTPTPRRAATPRLAALIACAAALVALVAACTSESIALATAAPLDGGGVPGDDVRCAQTPDCPQGTFCSKHDCGDPAGTCAAFPVLCPVDARPTCGCDGVTYWNDCHRQIAGAAASAAGECPRGVGDCGGPRGPCPGGSTCAYVTGGGPAPCAPDVPGKCWGLPPVCAPSADPNRWDACDGPERCIDTCAALLGGGRYHRAVRCPP